MKLWFWNKPYTSTRRPRLEMLEERIVLDASVDSGGQDNPDNPDQAETPLEQANGEVSGAAQHSTPAESIAPSAPDPLQAVLDQDLNAVIKGNAVDQVSGPHENGALESGDAARVLVVSSTLSGADLLAEATQDHVITVPYDGVEDSLDTILTSIGEALGDQRALSIAFATHETGDGGFYLTGEYAVTSSTLSASQELQTFWRGLGDFLAEGGRIDILACDVAGSETGLGLVNQLESFAGHEVAASDDWTGNSASGGDWY